MDLRSFFTCILFAIFVGTALCGFDKSEAIQHCEQVICEEQYLEMTEICNGSRDLCPETWSAFMACMKPCISKELEDESDEQRLYSSMMRRIEYSMEIEPLQKF
uniref:ShKT domain-containing protein n=1 Tax=Trichuris muris TaxID=70415 RepID=A0A5S6QEA4_TRIMR